MKRKLPKGKSLAEVNPELAKEWHPTKNGLLTPFNVSTGTHKKVWWKCDKGDDHEWEAQIANRNSLGHGCSICAGKTIVLSNCLKTLNPELAKEWHPTKNGLLTPFNVSTGTQKKVWWKCDKGDDHEWEAQIANRNSLGHGCSICAGQKIVLSNCLKTLNPELAKEWHPTKNGLLTPLDVSSGSHKKVWWKCDKEDDHEWEASIEKRSNGRGCPICNGKIIVKSNCLATINPKLSKEWHPTKNKKLTPYDVVPFTNKKVWWKCDKGDDHEWEAYINHRSKNSGCPICSGYKVMKSNCLATINPKLSKEWHPTKNKKLTPYDVVPFTNKKVWWKCDKGDNHEWSSTVNNRSKGQKCPFCVLTPQSRQELTITFELIIFFKINPKGFKTIVNRKLTSIDIFIKELNLGIEFDGHYWHKGNREFDKLKTERLEFEGFKIMRIREEPLKPITDIDIISTIPFNAKEVTNNILKHIMKCYTLGAKRKQKIEKYLLKEEIQNEKGLDAYIEKILKKRNI